jgi:hypothetical protein
MRKALSFIAFCAAAGYAATAALGEQAIGFLLAPYGHTGAVVNGSLGWFGFAMLASAALASVVAPRVTKMEACWPPSAIAFLGSVAATVAVCTMSVGCAAASLPVLPTDAGDAFAHASHWLFIGWLFAQLAVAGVMIVVRSHDDTTVSQSSYSLRGYAALER